MANISRELEKIRNGRYGIDIRQAIHDALKKINDEKEGGDKNG